jgi:hypothetical protein
MINRGYQYVHRLRQAQQVLGWRFPLTSLPWSVRPRYVILARDLQTPLPEARLRILTHWSILTAADIPAISAIDPAMSSPEVRRRLVDGQLCNLGWVGSDLAYYHWETAQPTYFPYLGLTLRPQPGQICGCGTYTAEEFRRLGVHTEAAVDGLRLKRERGGRVAIFFVAWWHGPSLRVYAEHLGGIEVGSIGFLNLGAVRRYFATGAVHLVSEDSFSIDA